MKVRAIAPALLAVVALIAIYLYTRGGSEADAPAPPVVKQQAPSAAPIATPPRSATIPPPATVTPPGAKPTEPPKLLTPEEYAGHEPVAKKPKMTLEEKLAEATKHIEVMERRAKLLEDQIAELDRTGNQEVANEKRVLVQRIRLHVEKLRKAVAEKREPE